MQTWIQSQNTKEYFDFSKLCWVRNRDGATPFENSTEAVRVCLGNGLREVQLVMEPGDGVTNEVVVPFA